MPHNNTLFITMIKRDIISFLNSILTQINKFHKFLLFSFSNDHHFCMWRYYLHFSFSFKYSDHHAKKYTLLNDAFFGLIQNLFLFIYKALQPINTCVRVPVLSENIYSICPSSSFRVVVRALACVPLSTWYMALSQLIKKLCHNRITSTL